MTVSGGAGLRVLIIVLATLVGAQLLIVGGGALMRARSLDEPVQPTIIAQVVAAAELLDSLPPEARENAIRALDSPFVHMRLLETFPQTETAGPPLAGFRPVIAAYTSALADRDVQVYQRQVGPRRRGLFLRRDRRPLAGELQVVLKLEGGGALSVEPGGVYRRSLAMAGLAFVSAIVGVALLAALVWASLATTRPLRTMAGVADQFSTDLDAPPMEERGPRAVRDLARAFNRMQARLRTLVSQRMTTLAAVSHDMRTYLTRLRLRAEFITDETQREKAVRDLDDMTALLEDTLSLARTAAAGDASNVETSDIVEIVRAVAGARSEAGEPVILDLNRFASPLPVCGSRSTLTRAVSNLIDNAVRYGRAAHVSFSATEEFATVIVQDEGPGVPAQELERLGEPFYRLETSRSRETGGSGLGLAIARAAAEQSGGGLTLKNTAVGLQAELRLGRRHDVRPEGGQASAVAPPSATAREPEERHPKSPAFSRPPARERP